MSRAQWDKLVVLMPTIQEYIRYAETGESWQSLATIQGHQLTEPQRAGAGAQVRMRAFDMTFVTLTALDDWYKGGCQVDVREFVWDKDNSSKLIPIRRGLTLIGGGFDFLARFLTPKVNAGLRMYSEIYEHAASFLELCYLRNSKDQDAATEDDPNLMPEPFEYQEQASGTSAKWPEASQYSSFY
jgi:hypothetical protein